jgi:AbrB family looped-hinge helix DNA binding protein
VKSLVTAKGQITIPKELREKFDIRPGAQMHFAAAPDGIRLRKVVDRARPSAALGCLRTELTGRSVSALLDDLRGPVALPRRQRVPQKARKR